MKLLSAFFFAISIILCLVVRAASSVDRYVKVSQQKETQDSVINSLDNADSFDVVPAGDVGLLATNTALFKFDTDLESSSAPLQQAQTRYKALAMDVTGQYLFAGSYDSSSLSARFDLQSLSNYLTSIPSIKTVDSFASDYTQCNDGDAYNVPTWETPNSERRVLAQVHVGAPYDRLYKLDQCWRLRETTTESPFTMKTLVGHKDIGAKLLDGLGTAGAVRNPRGLAFAAGKLWFVDRTSNSILVVRSYDLATQMTMSYGNVDDSSSSRGLTPSYQSTDISSSGLLLSEFALSTYSLSQTRTVPFQRQSAAESVEFFLMFDKSLVLMVDANTSTAFKVWPPVGVLAYTIKDVKPVDDNTILILADRGSVLSWDKVTFNWAVELLTTTTTVSSTTVSTMTTTAAAVTTTTMGAPPVPPQGSSSSGSSSSRVEKSDSSDSDDESAESATNAGSTTVMMTTTATAATTATEPSTTTAPQVVTTTTTAAQSPATNIAPPTESSSGSEADEDDDDADTVVINVYFGNSGASTTTTSLALFWCSLISSMVFLF